MGAKRSRRRRAGKRTGGTGENIGKTSVGTGDAGTGGSGDEAGGEGAGVGILSEGVAVHQGMNEIEVNTDQLVREAEAALAGAPVDTTAAGEAGMPAGPEAAQIAPPASWGPLVHGLGPTCRILVFPQWNIPRELGGEFAESLSQSLDMLFPGGLQGKYAPLARCFAAATGIVGGVYLTNGGKFPPLGPKRVAVDEEEGTGSDAGTGASTGASGPTRAAA